MADTDSSMSQVGFGDFETDERYKRLGRNLKSPSTVSIGGGPSHKDQPMGIGTKSGRLVDRSCSISTIYSGTNERTYPHAGPFTMQYPSSPGHGSSIIAGSSNSAVPRTRRDAIHRHSNGRGVVTSSLKSYSVQSSTRCNSESVFKLPAPVTKRRTRKERTTVERSPTYSPLNKGSSSRSPGRSHGSTEPILCRLIEWTVALNRDNQLIVKGKTENKDHISSKPILHRLSITKVESADRYHYCLEGVISDAKDSELPDYVWEKFYNGFPDDWVNVCQVWATFRQEGCPVNYRWPMSVADSDDDLRSVITDITVTSMTPRSRSPSPLRSSDPSDRNNEGRVVRHVGQRNDSCTQTELTDILPIVATSMVSPSRLPHTGLAHNRVRSVETETNDGPHSPVHYSFTTSEIDGLYNNCMTICNKLKFASVYGSIGNEFRATEEQSSFGTQIEPSNSAFHLDQCSRHYEQVRGRERDRSRHLADYDFSMAADRRERCYDFEGANRSAGNVAQFIGASKDNYPLSMSIERECDSVARSGNGGETCSDPLESEVYAGVRKIFGEKILSQHRETVARRQKYANRKRERATRRETGVWSAIGHKPVDRKAPCLQCARCNCSASAAGSVNNLRDTGSARVDSPRIAVNSKPVHDIENRPVVTNVDSAVGFRRTRPSTVRAPLRPLHQFEQQDHGTSDDERISEDEPEEQTSKRAFRVSGYVRHSQPRNKSEDARSADDRPPLGCQVSKNLCNGGYGVGAGARSSPCPKKPEKSSGPSATPIQEWKRPLVTHSTDSTFSSTLESERVNRIDESIRREKASTIERENGASSSRVAEISMHSPTDIAAIAEDDCARVLPRKRQLFDKVANGEKIPSTDCDDAMQEAKLLTAWTPMVAKSSSLDFEFQFGLIFQGNLLNDAGRIIRKDFKTSFVRRRISPTLIETVDSEFYRLVGKLVDRKKTVPKHLLTYCRNGCPSRVEQFCRMWVDSSMPEDPKHVSLTEKVEDSQQIEALEVSVSSRGRKIVPPLSYWTGERIVFKDDNPVYVPGISKCDSTGLDHEKPEGKDKKGSAPLPTSKRQDRPRTPLPPPKRRKVSVDGAPRTVHAGDAICSLASAGAGALGTRRKLSPVPRKGQTRRSIESSICSYYEPCSRQTDELSDDQLSHA